MFFHLDVINFWHTVVSNGFQKRCKILDVQCRALLKSNVKFRFKKRHCFEFSCKQNFQTHQIIPRYNQILSATHLRIFVIANVDVYKITKKKEENTQFLYHRKPVSVLHSTKWNSSEKLPPGYHRFLADGCK